MNTAEALSRTTFAALRHLSVCKYLKADPTSLAEMILAWFKAANPRTEERCREVGESAVMDCAEPCGMALIEPYDLED